MFLLFFNEWMNEGSLPKCGCKNGFAGYAKSWYLFCQCLLQCSIIALMPFVFFPPPTPSERLIICWWSLCFVLLQQHDRGWWDVYQEVLQRFLHRHSEKDSQVCEVHLWPVPGYQWQAWQEDQQCLEWDGGRGKKSLFVCVYVQVCLCYSTTVLLILLETNIITHCGDVLWWSSTLLIQSDTFQMKTCIKVKVHPRSSKWGTCWPHRYTFYDIIQVFHSFIPNFLSVTCFN